MCRACDLHASTFHARYRRVEYVSNTHSTRRAHVSSTSYTLRARFDFNRMLVWASVERTCNVCQACFERAMKRIQRVCSTSLACLGHTTNVLQNFEIFYTSGTRLSHALMCDCKSELKEQINFIRPKSSAC